ncbi:MAG: type II toxin-antitoxin system RatA family toxin [Gammaproteobacteria bacterium]|nr:type II toxin-antitoxin system RatA family toxin [Gammaproteobacteria bacterium]
MRKVSRSALVPHSASEMFALVDDIESYPQFLPWCSAATVHERDESVVDATLKLESSGFSKSFTTRNTLRRDEAISLALLGGPFRHLDGGWRFQQLGDDGCKVSLNLEFEFESLVTDLVFGRVFEEICTSLVDAFTERAKTIYGE